MSALLAVALVAAPVQLALAQQQPAPAADDFELLPPERAPEAQLQRELERKLALRREMLQLHQLGGFATLGTLGATVVFGQLNYSDKYGGGGDTQRFMALHRWLGIGTTVVFAATGALAVFAPSPLARPVRLDTVTVHKVALAIASAGMLAQIILGPVIASKEGQTSQRDFALAHQIVGYATLAATATGAVALTF